MSDAVFKQGYADQYDLFYRDKDYESECDLLEQAFKRYGKEPVQSILDLGCGTGNHAFPLAHRGYRVTGVDLSADMLVHAREKTSGIQLPEGSAMPMFVQGDVCSIDLGEQFDAILMMFAVLGYQLTNDDVLAALHTVRCHLKPGGLFIFDIWYGPAVLAIRPSERIKVISSVDSQVIRTVSGSLDTFHHLSEVNYHIWRLSGKQVLGETQESHQMRYFFPQELALFLKLSDLELVTMSEFGDLNRRADADTWNVLVVAQ